MKEKETTIKYNDDTYISMSVYNYKIMCKDKEIERLTAESTEWESKFYDEAKKVDKAIDLLEEARENIDLPWYDRQHLIEKTIYELKGADKK